MNSKAQVYIDAITREVEEWPGVTVDFTEGGKHPKAKFIFNGETLFRPFSGTATTAIRTMLGDMRRVMRQLGAERAKPESDAEDEKHYSPPNNGRAARPDPVAAEPVKQKDPKAPLAELAEKMSVPEPIRDTAIFDAFDREPIAKVTIVTDGKPGSGWGLYPAMGAVQYHLDPCPEPSISNSLIPYLIDQTPQDFAWQHPRLAPPERGEELVKTTVAARRGDIVHQLALGKGRGYAVGDFPDWRTKAAREFKDDAEEAGLTPTTKEKFAEAEAIAARVIEKIKIATDGADYETEVPFMYQEETESGLIWVRGMMDIWCPELGLIVDPKITPRMYDKWVGRHILDMGWDRQCALYAHAIGKIFPERAGRVQFVDLMVHPEAPHIHRFVAPEKSWDYSSIKQCRIAFERFGRCMKTGEWPGFGDGLDYIPMPTWEAKRREESELRN